MVAVISHGVIFAKPRLCHYCDKVMEPGRPSTYVGLECNMCGYAVCTSCNVDGGGYKDMKRTMKGLTIQCAGCQDWGQGGISTMFRAGPTGSIEGEGFAYAFLKNFYEEGMEWNGVEWSGMEWNGVEWSGMKWNGVEWSGMDWNGVEWSGMEWNGVEWSGMGWNGVEWSGMDWNGVEWSGMEWNGVEW